MCQVVLGCIKIQIHSLFPQVVSSLFLWLEVLRCTPLWPPSACNMLWLLDPKSVEMNFESGNFWITIFVG